MANKRTPRTTVPVETDVLPISAIKAVIPDSTPAVPPILQTPVKEVKPKKVTEPKAPKEPKTVKPKTVDKVAPTPVLAENEHLDEGGVLLHFVGGRWLPKV